MFDEFGKFQPINNLTFIPYKAHDLYEMNR